jgi:hypothetical protein
MQKTANQIKSEFELLASGHYQIHSFLYAQEFEQQAYENLIYPLMLVYPLGGSLSGTSYTRNYRVVIADRVLKSEGNELEVESDTQLIALDVLAYWMKLGTNERFSITSSNTITPFWEKWGDEVTGHFVDIGIEEFYDFNSCAIPLSSAIPSPTNPCKDARILINSVVYGNAPSDTNFNVVVKDQLGALVGSLIGGEWIVNTGGACADATYTIEDSLGNILYTGTIPSGGSATEVIGNSTLNVNKSDGTLISSRSILAEGTDSYNVGDSSAVLKDEDGNVLSTTPIKATETEDIVAPNGDVSVNSVAFDDVLSGGTLNIEVLKSTGNDLIGSKQGQYWRIGDSTAVIKDSANNTLKSEAIMATETENIVVNDSVAVIKNSVGTTLKSENILAEATENITINDSSVENSDATYSVDVLAEGSLVLPDSQINVNGVDEGDVVSVKTIDVNLEDSLGDPVTPTSVGLVGNTLTIEVPSGGGSYDLDLVDRFGNAFPTKQVTANATWDLRTLTPFDFADIFLSELTAPSSTIQTAIIDLVDDLNAAGLWDKFHTIHPLVNGSANDHALNLKYPFRNRYSFLAYYEGSPTHNSNGITTNGSSNGMIIPINPFHYQTTNDQFGMSFYSRTDAASGGGSAVSFDMGSTLNGYAEYNGISIRDSANDQLFTVGGGSFVYYNNNYTGDTLGLVTGVLNGTVGGISKNGVLLTGGSTGTVNLSAFRRTSAIALGGVYFDSTGILTGRVARNYAYCATMKLFNMTQEADHYTAVQTFQTAMSRQV